MPCGISTVDETVTIICVSGPGIVQGGEVEADVVLPVIELEMLDVGRGLRKKRNRVYGIRGGDVYWFSVQRQTDKEGKSPYGEFPRCQDGITSNRPHLPLVYDHPVRFVLLGYGILL